MTTPAAHWDHVYTTKDTTQVSWYQPVPETSLRLISTHAPPHASTIDVGAGASFLVEYLLEMGHTDITLLDVSAVALQLTRARLGPGSATVHTLATDLLAWSPDRTWQVWHDRAVFHFLTDPTDIARYRDNLLTGLAKGGLVVLAAFHTSGPERCSGLPTARYDAVRLHNALGGADKLDLVESFIEAHPHPNGTTQSFQVVALRRR